jgi:hypothetical protein
MRGGRQQAAYSACIPRHQIQLNMHPVTSRIKPVEKINPKSLTLKATRILKLLYLVT